MLSFLLLLTAWEVKHFTRSLFNLDPTRNKGPFSVFHAVYYNRFLFWAVVIGALSVFPAVYIPVLNTNVFKHVGISWEWGLVVGMTVVYVLGVEAWKFTKRTMNILDDHAVVKGRWSQGSEEGRKFTKTLSMGSLRSWKSWAKHDTKGRPSSVGGLTQSNTLANEGGGTRGGDGHGSPNLSQQDTIV